ncbi:MAG: hypothetical protein OXG53_17585 [Chloroflexi bacterium]|nr:hypothetical protein [Chloroflexota bacterium]
MQIRMCRIIAFLALALAASGIGYAQDRGWATAIAWSPDGETIAVGSSTGVWLFDTEFNETGYVATPEMKGYPPDSIDWNASGDLIAISVRNDDTPVLIISAENLRVITQINTSFPLSVRWHPHDNIFVSVSFFEAIIWDALTGEELVHIGNLESEYFNHLYAVCWLTGDEIALLGDRDIFRIRVSDQTTLQTFGNLRGSAVDCHLDEKLATADGRVYDVDAGRRLRTDSGLATLDNYTFE